MAKLLNLIGIFFSAPTDKVFDTSDPTMWEQGKTYTIYLHVQVGNYQLASTSHTVLVNYEPYGGSGCEVYPTEGD